MIEISNKNFNLIVEKMPTIIALALGGGKQLTLRQYNDIRTMRLLHAKLKKKQNNLNIK